MNYFVDNNNVAYHVVVIKLYCPTQTMDIALNVADSQRNFNCMAHILQAEDSISANQVNGRIICRILRY